MLFLFNLAYNRYIQLYLSDPAMHLILIRHAERERASDPALDPQTPLSPAGKAQAKALGDRLLHLGLRPALYLTSRYTHAVETAEVLRDQIGGNPIADVVGSTHSHRTSPIRWKRFSVRRRRPGTI
jgi:phosphohistidine phosphatase SixA